MKVKVPYGDSFVPAELPEHTLYLSSKAYPVVKDTASAVRKALAEPIGTGRLGDMACQGDRAAVVINDITRPAPTREMLEEILGELSGAGITGDDVTVIVATGTHRPNDDHELAAMVGEEIFKRIKVINHNCLDPEQLSFLGAIPTDRGQMPIYINKLFAGADLKIATGIITPHQAAGYSGGRKSIVPGIAGFETIRFHHFAPNRGFEPMIGKIRDNEFHAEALAGAKKASVDFIVNAVKGARGDVVAVVAGHMELAHREGVRICREIWEVPVPYRADICLVSPGGLPWDMDLDMSQKALSCAEMVTKRGSIIILAAECSGEVGVFEKFFDEAGSPLELIEQVVKEGFTSDRSVKAFLLARLLDRNPVIVVSHNLSARRLENLFLKKAGTIEEAFQMAAGMLGKTPEQLLISYIPHATSIVPAMDEY